MYVCNDCVEPFDVTPTAQPSDEQLAVNFVEWTNGNNCSPASVDYCCSCGVDRPGPHEDGCPQVKSASRGYVAGRDQGRRDMLQHIKGLTNNQKQQVTIEQLQLVRPDDIYDRLAGREGDK